MGVVYRQKISASFLIASLLMAFIALRAYTLPGQQAEQGEWVVHTHQVLHQLETLSSHLTDAENNQRGYLLTGKQEYLQPYEEALKRIDGDIAQFVHLTQDNSIQQKQIPLLRERLETQMALLKKAIEQNSAHTEELSRRSDPVIHDTQETGLIERQIGEMQAEEYKLLDERLDRWHNSVTHTSWIFLGSVIMLYALVCIIYYVIRNESRYRKQLLQAEQIETERLMHIVAIQREVSMHHQNLQAAMQSICNRTQMLASADGAIVEMLEGDEMVYRAVSGMASPHLGMRFKADTSLSGRSIKENRVFVCDDALDDERVNRDACEKVGLRSMVVVPLRHEGEAIGILKVLSKTACAFREHNVATLELIASTLSATINDAATAEALKTANERLREANTELAYQKTDLQSANILLEGLATTDGLTGLKNHRNFQERLTEEYHRAVRHKSALSLVLMDVDHFKSYNDSFGHPAGDQVLKRVALLLQEAARSSDCVARYGGEEFALLLPETNAEGARIIAERIRQRIETTPWDERPITVSIGISSLGPATDSAAQLLKISDSALYQSKTLGRNRVTHANEMNFS